MLRQIEQTTIYLQPFEPKTSSIYAPEPFSLINHITSIDQFVVSKRFFNPGLNFIWFTSSEEIISIIPTMVIYFYRVPKGHL